MILLNKYRVLRTAALIPTHVEVTCDRKGSRALRSPLFTPFRAYITVVDLTQEDESTLGIW